MRGSSTVTLNGETYDKATGLPVRKKAVAVPVRHSLDDILPMQKKTHTPVHAPKREAPPQAGSARQHTSSHTIHATPQRSHTLHRAGLQKPSPAHHHSTAKPHTTVTKSPHISKFAPHPQPLKKPRHTQAKKQAPQPQSVPVTHEQKKTAPPSSQHVKNHLIKQHLAQAQDTSHDEPVNTSSSRGRMASVLTASLALVVLGGYLTYLNMPGLSMRVAAVQAGLHATMPDYQPDGYRFDGPITFSQGEVLLSYQSNGGPHEYSVTQRSSDWDSQAVRENYVMPQFGDDYRIHSVQGLTVYTSDTAAVWVNRGILHEINFKNAPLSGSQVERIAASM